MAVNMASMSKVLAQFIPVCDAIARLLHPHAEVVLHDLASGKIFYLANAYSKRRAGDPSLNEPEPFLDLKENVIGPYAKTNWDGRRLKSITAVLRDDKGRELGLLCINHDIEAFSGALEQIRHLIAIPSAPEKPAGLFAGDWREGVNDAIGAFLSERGVSLAGLSGAELDHLLLALEQKGIFAIRKAVPYVAGLLKLSRATIYNRLGAARTKAAKSKARPKKSKE